MPERAGAFRPKASDALQGVRGVPKGMPSMAFRLRLPPVGLGQYLRATLAREPLQVDQKVFARLFVRECGVQALDEIVVAAQSVVAFSPPRFREGYSR